MRCCGRPVSLFFPGQSIDELVEAGRKKLVNVGGGGGGAPAAGAAAGGATGGAPAAAKAEEKKKEEGECRLA